MNKTVTDNISKEELEAILNPETYTGHSAYFARTVSANIKKAREND